MLNAVMKKNDRQARWLIGVFSFVVFAVVVSLDRIKLDVRLGFDPHIFATVNAVLNSIVAVLLVIALVAVKKGQYRFHKRMMISAMVLSILFLVSYICHHLFAGQTRFGGEGALKYIYYIVLITHVFLAAIILPFILFTAYRGLIAEWPGHKKLGKITWPIWFYVALTGPIVYWLISPYYT